MYISPIKWICLPLVFPPLILLYHCPHLEKGWNSSYPIHGVAKQCDHQHVKVPVSAKTTLFLIIVSLVIKILVRHLPHLQEFDMVSSEHHLLDSLL